MTPYLDELINEKCKQYNINRRLILSRSKERNHYMARHDVWYTAYTKNKKAYSVDALSIAFDRDPTTIRNGVNMFKKRKLNARLD